MIICEEFDCLHYLGGICKKEDICIEIKATGEFRRGDHLTYPVCRDFKEVQGGGD